MFISAIAERAGVPDRFELTDLGRAVVAQDLSETAGFARRGFAFTFESAQAISREQFALLLAEKGWRLCKFEVLSPDVGEAFLDALSHSNHCPPPALDDLD